MDSLSPESIAAAGTAQNQSPEQAELFKSKFTLERLDDLMDLPPQKWIVKYLFQEKGVGYLFAMSDVGKSFLAIDLAFHVSSPSFSHWFEQKIKKHVPVVYFAVEDPDGIAIRMTTYRREKHITDDDIFLVRQPLNLKTSDDISSLIPAIPQGALVIIDTQSAAIPGLDENSNGDMGQVIDRVRRFAEQINGFVLMIAHTAKNTDPTKTPTPRGAYNQFCNVDSLISVEKKNEDAPRKWESIKVKGAPCGIKGYFTLKKIVLSVDEDDGDTEHTCIVEPLEENTGKSFHEVQKQSLTNKQQPVYDSFCKTCAALHKDSLTLKEWLPYAIKDKALGRSQRPDTSLTQFCEGIAKRGFIDFVDGVASKVPDVGME